MARGEMFNDFNAAPSAATMIGERVENAPAPLIEKTFQRCQVLGRKGSGRVGFSLNESESVCVTQNIGGNRGANTRPSRSPSRKPLTHKRFQGSECAETLAPAARSPAPPIRAPGAAAAVSRRRLGSSCALERGIIRDPVSSIKAKL